MNNHHKTSSPWRRRTEVAVAISSFMVPGGLALLIPWSGQSEGFVLLALTHLLGYSLVSLSLTVLLRLLSSVGAGSNFGGRLAIGFVGAGLVTFAALRWLAGFEGHAGNPVLVVTQILTMGMMLLVVGYLFEFLGAFTTQMGSWEKKESESEAAS